MPVKIGQLIPIPEQPYVDIVPDVRTDVPLDFVPDIAMEQLLEFPGKLVNGMIVPDFSSFTPEQLKLFEDKYRFQGIRLRHDIKDRTIPLTKETLDIP